MPTIPETPEDHAARLTAQLQGQRTMLEHLPKWIKLRGLRQKDVAHSLGVSEPTVSSWISGAQQMSVGQLRQIAALLGAKEGDLLSPPDDPRLSGKVEETLSLMDQLTDAEWQAIMQNARMLAEAKRKN